MFHFRSLYNFLYHVTRVSLNGGDLNRVTRNGTYRNNIIRYCKAAVITTLTSTLCSKGLPGRERARLFNRTLTSLFTRSMMLILKGFNQNGPYRILRRARSKSVSLIINGRVSALTYVNRNRLLQNTCSSYTHSNRDLRNNRISITYTKEGISRRMIRLTPYNVASRLLRNVTHRTTAPSNNLIKISRRASKRRLRTVILSKSSRITSISTLNVKTNVLRLGRLKSKKTRSINIRRACLMTRLNRYCNRINHCNTFTRATLTTQCNSSILCNERRLLRFKAYLLSNLSYSNGLCVNANYRLSNYLNALRS